jgi:hypothetical protein
MPLTEPSRSTKVIVFVAALVCTTFPNGGDDFVLDVIERGRFHIGATLLNWVWISLVSIGLLWLLRQMSGYAKRWSWLPPLALLGCLGATPVFGIVFCELLDEKVRPVSVLIFLLIWAGMAVRTLAVVFQSLSPPSQRRTQRVEHRWEWDHNRPPVFRMHASRLTQTRSWPQSQSTQAS